MTMGKPVELAPDHFFEFVGKEEPTVVFLSIHPAHKASQALVNQLAGGDRWAMPVGSVGVLELLHARSPALSFLRHGLCACGVESALEVLPGYYLFQEKRLLAWELGLPIRGDAVGILKGSFLAALIAAFTKNAAFLAQAVVSSAEQAAAKRIGERFKDAAAAYQDDPQPQSPPRGRVRAEDLAWAMELLGLKAGCSQSAVDAAWRAKRREVHPDLAAGDSAEFERRTQLSVRLNRAREVVLQAILAGRAKRR